MMRNFNSYHAIKEFPRVFSYLWINFSRLLNKFVNLNLFRQYGINESDDNVFVNYFVYISYRRVLT